MPNIIRIAMVWRVLTWNLIQYEQVLSFFKNCLSNLKFSCIFRLSPSCMNVEKWKKFWAIELLLQFIFEHCAQPILIFNRENPQNFKSPNGLRRGHDYIALQKPITNWTFWTHQVQKHYFNIILMLRIKGMFIRDTKINTSPFHLLLLWS